MEKEGITVYDMINQMIRDGQFSANQEDALGMMLADRKEKREEERLSRCLYGIVMHEMDVRVSSGEVKQSTAKRYRPVIQRCFNGKYGNMDAAEINEEIIQEFILEAIESYGLDRNEMSAYMRMLKQGLREMEKKEMLSFKPPKSLFTNHFEYISGTKLIDCPYAGKEQLDIGQWIASHPTDARGLACGLWLLGGDGLSPDKIINIKGQDAWKYCPDGLKAGDGILDFDPDERRAEARKSIIETAMKIHPEETSYVFMVPKKESKGWKKLSGPVLQTKMSWICSSLNIKYKAFHHNEAIISKS